MRELSICPTRRAPRGVRRPAVFGFGSVVALAISALPATAAVNYRTVVLSGTHAPGTPTGASFRAFSNDVFLTPDGKTVFSADLVRDAGGVTSQNYEGIWSETNGPLSLVARQGDQAPGTPAGTKFQTVGTTIINADGHVVFVAGLTGTGVSAPNNTGIWGQDPGGAVKIIAREADPIPGAPSGTTIGTFNNTDFQLAAGPRGTAAFTALDKDSGGNYREGVLYSDGTTLSLVAQAGTQGAGLPPGANYGTFEYGMLRMDAQAKVTFFGLLNADGTTVTYSSDDAIWHGDPSGLRLVARQGDPAPGAPAGTPFGNLGPPTINARGQVAFRVELPGGGSGIWSEGHGSLAPVAQVGEQAPGTAAGVKFNYLSDQAISDSGSTSFFASLKLNEGGVTDSNDTGIWSDGSGALALVAREGSQAPGAPDGAVFGRIDPPVMNGPGKVAFRAILLPGSGGVTADSDVGVWAEDPNGVLSLIVREGDPFQVAPGDVRTIQYVSFRDDTGPDDFPGCAYTDNYTLAFALGFTDGTNGVFTATLVPEPGALTAALLSGLALRRPRRRTRTPRR